MTTAPSPSFAHMHQDAVRKNTIIAMLLTAVAYAYFNIGDAALKMLTLHGFKAPQIIVTNSAIIIFCMAVSGFISRGKAAFKMKSPKLVIARAALSFCVSMLNTTALPHITLTKFYTLVFTSPFWVALLAAVMLKEKLDPRRIGVILFGFSVILFIFPPGSGLLDIYSGCILLGAFLYSCAMVLMRKMGPDESRTMILIMGSTVSIIFSAPFIEFKPPTPYEWGLFGMMGLLGAISITCIAYAFQTAPSAAVVAPFHYTQIIWGALLGFFLFNEVPAQRTLIGAVLLIAAGLYLILTETRRKPKLPDAEGAVVST